ncbi:serf family protein [Sporothrix brasiliensis 5110]|uniref:Serf family protein n=1 Tax=Sporothrix brasiliensis 5110 TaxID=1398154 RepID=A0A0C2J3E2_9PEZI|nr:serf family protein [Sporothrix brasiliensis 5110]KIH91572.1 serf family protein [Sporothrix brasiliensis 5110]
MARGNQRDKAREKNLKAQAGQKKANTKSGTEMQRDRDELAKKMREKQAAGEDSVFLFPFLAASRGGGDVVEGRWLLEDSN